MIKITGTTEELNDLNKIIIEGLKNNDPLFNAVIYSDLYEDKDGLYIFVDENDLRNPLQFIPQKYLENGTIS